MTIEDLDHFVLAGGTGLSLQIGHRKSADIDLFTRENFSISLVKEHALELYPDASITYQKNDSISFFIQDVKVEFVKWTEQFPLHYNLFGSWRILRKDVIAAMKLNAILNRDEKKDFADLYFLLKEWSLYELLNIYLERYPYFETRPILERLVSIQSVRSQPNPIFLVDITWEEIINGLKGFVKDFYEGAKKKRQEDPKDLVTRIEDYRRKKSK